MNGDWDSSSGAPAGGAVDTDSSWSHEQPAENTTFSTRNAFNKHTHSLTHHVCGSVAARDVMHSGRCQVMLVRLRNLLQRILMRNTRIHTQIPANTFHWNKTLHIVFAWFRKCAELTSLCLPPDIWAAAGLAVVRGEAGRIHILGVTCACSAGLAPAYVCGDVTMLKPHPRRPSQNRMKWRRVIYLRCSNCCWMRYCCCKAWGRKGGGTSWYWGGARGGGGNSAGRGVAVAARWKWRQEVAWACWCLLKCAPVRGDQSQNRVQTRSSLSNTIIGCGFTKWHSFSLHSIQWIISDDSIAAFSRVK